MYYHNSNTLGQANSEGYLLKSGLPTFAQSWSLSAKVTIPLAAEGLPSSFLPIESYTEVGVACFFGGNAFSFGLQVETNGAPITREVLAEVTRDGTESFDGQGNVATTKETVTLLIRYNSTNRLLQAYADGKQVLDLDIAADGTNNSTRVLDWGMTAQSVFQIAFFANSSNYKVAQDCPLQLDDFSLHIEGAPIVQPPALNISRQAVVVAAIGNPAQKYELQQSDNMADWITTATIYGTGGALQIPVSADTTNCFFRLK